MRVCHIATGDQWAGAEVQLATVMRGLAARGEFDLAAIVLHEGKLADELRAVGLPVFLLEERRFNAVGLVSQIRRVLRENNISILHTHKRKDHILGSLAARMAGVPHVVRTIHGLEDTHLRYRDPGANGSLILEAIKGYKTWCVNRLDGLVSRTTTRALIAVSHDIAKRVNASHLQCQHTEVVHNGIEWEALSKSSERAGIRSELGVGSDVLLVGTAGRLVPIKGVDVFLEAAKAIAGVMNNVKFLIIGDGPLRKRLEETASVLGIENKVIFTGFRDDIHDLLRLMDVFVMTSFYEGIPLVVLEAMALGKPVVLSHAGGHVEILEDIGREYLVPPGDSARFAQTCLGLLSSNEERTRVGLVNTHRVRNHFSGKRMTDQMAQIYKRLLHH